MCNVQHIVTNHIAGQISQEWRAALPSPFTGGWLHVFIQKMHYSLASCQLYFLVPLSSFLAHLLAFSHILTEHPLPAHWKAHQLKTNKPHKGHPAVTKRETAPPTDVQKGLTSVVVPAFATLLFSLTPAWSTSYLQWDRVHSKEIIWNCHIKLSPVHADWLTAVCHSKPSQTVIATQWHSYKLNPHTCTRVTMLMAKLSSDTCKQTQQVDTAALLPPLLPQHAQWQEL